MPERKIAIIGLGYVGLPLAVAFAKKYPVIGFDIDSPRIQELKDNYDRTGEIDNETLNLSKQLSLSSEPESLKGADFYIVTVPTPLDNAKQPDLSPLIKASSMIGEYLNPGDIVVYESTVYPGVTEDICIPILEKHSGLKGGTDFTVGYSPERINPGDKEHTVEKINKVVSGQDQQTLDIVASVYGSVIQADIHKAPSIKVAEAAKVIENTQRDLNIALMNELARLFNKLDIDTNEVLAAANTKWNFLNFKPGLVGGHCIGVDPYYLTYKANQVGFQPEVILAGRHINDTTGKFIAEQTVKHMIQANTHINNANIAIFGLSFKENCPDLRNTKVVDIINELNSYGINVHVHDPYADANEAQEQYGLSLMPWENIPEVDAIILAVSHDFYADMPQQQLLEKLQAPYSVIDIKGMLDPKNSNNINLWRL